MLNSSFGIRRAAKIARKLTVSLSLFLVAACNSAAPEPKTNAQVINTPEKNARGVNSPELESDDLGQAASRLVELFDDKNCKGFVNAFPNNIDMFVQLYGYDDKKGEHVLHSKLDEHISYFFSCPDISDLEKLHKAIRVGIGGKWDADAVDAFQDSTFELVKRQPDEAKKILDEMPDNKASSFWYFLFDGPHPGDRENLKKVDLLAKLMGKKSTQARLLSEQYKKLTVEWNEH